MRVGRDEIALGTITYQQRLALVDPRDTIAEEVDGVVGQRRKRGNERRRGCKGAVAVVTKVLVGLHVSNGGAEGGFLALLVTLDAAKCCHEIRKVGMQNMRGKGTPGAHKALHRADEQQRQDAASTEAGAHKTAEHLRMKERKGRWCSGLDRGSHIDLEHKSIRKGRRGA
jgi:hypothetical protein